LLEFCIRKNFPNSLHAGLMTGVLCARAEKFRTMRTPGLSL
jgi:hypothetical protein